MRAWITKSFNASLIKENVAIPKIWANGQVLIKVKVCIFSLLK